MAFLKVATTAELGDGEVLGVRSGGREICLVRIEDAVYAIADKCSHRDFPLSNGEIDPDACTITCEWHGARFDLSTGKALSLPATRPVPVFACRIEGDEILVDLD